MAASAAARRLVEAQADVLPGVLAEVRAAGESYEKRTHYAWYVWPTTKEGMCDGRQTAVKKADDVLFVLSNSPALAAWTELLESFAALLESKAKIPFPPIDHGRIDYFCSEWGAHDYAEVMQSCAPAFAVAQQRFADAWQRKRATQPSPSFR